MVKKISEVTYRIQLLSNHRKRVVHFDRLKLFKGKIQDEFPNNSGSKPVSKESHKKDVGSPDQASSPVIEEYLELCNDEDDEAPQLAITGTAPPNRPYPSHSHHASARFNDCITLSSI